MRNIEQQNSENSTLGTDEIGFALPKKNIIYIIAGFFAMLLGYLLMLGGGSEDPNIFNYEMFSTIRLVIAPVIILIGICIIIWAIMYKGKKA